MRSRILITILILALTTGASAQDNKYDIGNYLEHASQIVSTDVDYFFISEMMIALSNGNMNVQGIKLGDVRNKIEFIRSVNIKSNKTQQEKSLLHGAEDLATRVYKQHGYKSIMVNSRAGKRLYLFCKSADEEFSKISSLLLIITQKEIDPATQKPQLTNANVCLMGGEFTTENLKSLLKQIE